MDFLKSAVASAIAKGSSLPYSFGDRVDSSESIWSLFNGTKRDDSSICSIFAFDIAADRGRLPLAKNAVRKLRTLRHPGVIKVFETIETETNIYIVTERVTPLLWHVKRRSISEETAKWGLYTVASTLKFINEDASSVHGAVRASSIYASEGGEWKLGGFEILSSMKEDDAIIYTYGSLLPDSGRFSPPEVTRSGWDVIKRNPLTATDSWAYGSLIFEVFNGHFMADQITSMKNIPPSMQQSYKRLVNTNPKLRLSVGHFLEQGKKGGGFFETPLIRLTQGIESLGLKDEAERDKFLGELGDVSDDFPEEFFKMKVLPELLKSIEYGGGGPKVLGVIMKIASKLSDDEYESRITPVIVRLFAIPDRAMRVSLLDNLPLMVDRLPQKVVNGQIFPQMVTGFTDVAPVVREQTVKAVLTVISKLSDRVINGELLRYLAKTANDEQPGIRTNTTICLGKIARHLGANTRQKVLIAAFTRSLRDPFVHGRNAALMALAATLDVFSEADCATKLLPALCPSLIDSEKLVRDQANKTFDLYLQRVRKFGTGLPETTLPPPGSTDSATARIGTQNDTSWAGWAISSFTNKMTAAKGEMQSGGTNGMPHAKPAAEPRSTSMPPSRTPASSTMTNTLAPEKPSPSRSSAPRMSGDRYFEGPTFDDEDPGDAWGTMDDDDDDDDEKLFFDAPAENDAGRTSREAAKPVAFDDGGEPDFAGWLAAQALAKSKKPLPKGLAKAKEPASSPSMATPTPRPSAGPRSSTTGSVGSGTGTKKLTSATTTTKKTDTKPIEEAHDDDGWGDAWD